MQTQTPNTLHNAIMEADSKDRPPMVAPDWKEKEVPISEGSPITRTERVHESYKNVSQEIRDQLNVEAEAVQIILTGIDNDIYSTVDACPNAYTSRANQDNSPRINRSFGYENQRIGNVVGARETVGSTVTTEQADWRDDTDDDELEDQELEAHYMYMAQLQEVSPDPADSGPIFDDEPLKKESNDDHYNVFSIKSEHPEQSKSVHDTYPIEHDAQNVIIDSLDMSYKREKIDHNDDDNDLAKERQLLASLIGKLKCEIDESKNCNKFLETSNKVLIEKLKGEIKDFKNKNKSLESSNNYFKEANDRLSETNNLLYADYKKSKAKLTRRNSMEYASQMELECAKVKGDFFIIQNGISKVMY
nr:hypothetical protein [Tanacetum cinerariifolium]